MEKCPKCGAVLNNDEKASGKCFACNYSFESSIPKDIVRKPETVEGKISQMADDIHFIKNVVLAEVIITIIAMVIMFFWIIR